MRPIDADAIKLPKGFFEEVDNVPKFYEWLNELPTIDAVPREEHEAIVYAREQIAYNRGLTDGREDG